MPNPSGSVADRDVKIDTAGAASGKAGKRWFLRPSRTDIRISVGGTWTPWPYNPQNPIGHQFDIMATTNADGEFALPLWYTDTEVDLPDSAPVPALEWLVIQEETGRVWRGPFPSTIAAAAYSLKQLLSLQAPNTWRESGTLWSAYPEGNERHISITFTSASPEAGIQWQDIGGANWKFTAGIYADADGRLYTVACKPGSKAATGATFVLSDKPVSGKDVTVDLRIWR